MPVPIGIALGFGAGAFIGAIARQPEINRLRNQVKLLQQEINSLQELLQEQQRQIEELKLRFETLSAYHFVEKRKVRGITRGYLIFQYGFHEYVGLLLRQSKSVKIVNDDARFFSAFAAVIADETLADSEKTFIRSYVLRLHARAIDDLKPLGANEQHGLLDQVRAA